MRMAEWHMMREEYARAYEWSKLSLKQSMRISCVLRVYLSLSLESMEMISDTSLSGCVYVHVCGWRTSTSPAAWSP